MKTLLIFLFFLLPYASGATEDEFEEQVYFGELDSQDNTRHNEKRSLRLSSSMIVINSIEVQLKDLAMECRDSLNMPCNLKEFRDKKPLDYQRS